jgi:hypothetical protein
MQLIHVTSGEQQAIVDLFNQTIVCFVEGISGERLPTAGPGSFLVYMPMPHVELLPTVTILDGDRFWQALRGQFHKELLDSFQQTLSQLEQLLLVSEVHLKSAAPAVFAQWAQINNFAVDIRKRYQFLAACVEEEIKKGVVLATTES